MRTKTCLDCDRTLDASEFRGPTYVCRKCENARRRERVATDPVAKELAYQSARSWIAANPERARERQRGYDEALRNDNTRWAEKLKRDRERYHAKKAEQGKSTMTLSGEDPWKIIAEANARPKKKRGPPPKL